MACCWRYQVVMQNGTMAGGIFWRLSNGSRNNRKYQRRLMAQNQAGNVQKRRLEWAEVANKSKRNSENIWRAAVVEISTSFKRP